MLSTWRVLNEKMDFSDYPGFIVFENLFEDNFRQLVNGRKYIVWILCNNTNGVPNVSGVIKMKLLHQSEHSPHHFKFSDQRYSPVEKYISEKKTFFGLACSNGD